MRLKKSFKKNIPKPRGLSSFVQKKLKLPKIKVSPKNIIEETKGKIGSFYKNFKKERLKEKKRLEKTKKLEEKKEELRQKKQAQKERIDKIKEEKRKELAQKKLIIDNEKQIKKMRRSV